MIKEFNNLEEIQKYYIKEINTYVFEENGEYIDLVVFKFDLNVKANIEAWDIKAKDIKAKDINAWNITALDIEVFDINADYIIANDINAWNIYASDITASDITYYAVCFAYNNIKCKSIKGIRINSKHFVLDGKLEVENE